jgi:hypothetical protein
MCKYFQGSGSSVSIGTRRHSGRPGFDSQWRRRIYHPFAVSGWLWGPPSPCAVGIGGSFPMDNMWPGCTAHHSPPRVESEKGAIPPLLPEHLLAYSGVVMMMMKCFQIIVNENRQIYS